MDKNIIEEVYKLIQEEVNKEGKQPSLEEALEKITSVLKIQDLNADLKEQSDNWAAQLKSILPEDFSDLEKVKEKASDLLKTNSVSIGDIQKQLAGVLKNEDVLNQLVKSSSGKNMDLSKMVNGVSSLLQGSGAGSMMPLNLLKAAPGMDMMGMAENVLNRIRKRSNGQQNSDQSEHVREFSQSCKNFDECDLWY
ncbi:hypothetical protein ACQ0QQ_16455 [Lysinibacillus sphaericus]